jgi:formate-dependent nitrite reductase membrane component NrfD
VSQGQTAASGVARRGRGGGERSMVPPGEPRSYYGEPIVAKPVWTVEIPIYFWTGGICGAALPLSLFASLRGNQPLARRAALVGLGMGTVSPMLLVSDLGRPSRFLNMLRVFKVTSPMSVGSWILSATGLCAALANARELLGLFPRLGRAAQWATVILGPGLSTYTATLIANTAVPVWHEARDELPFVFAATSAATAGAIVLAVTPPEHAGAALRLTVGGGVAELVLLEAMERRLGPLGEPYRTGRAGVLARAAKALTAAGVVGAALGRGRREVIVGSAVAVLAGGLAERWSIFRAGTASANDPRYTVGPQRERLRGSTGIES